MLQRYSLKEQFLHVFVQKILNFIHSRRNGIHDALDGALPLEIIESLDIDAHRRAHQSLPFKQVLFFPIVVRLVIPRMQVLLPPSNRIKVPHLLDRVVLQHFARFGERVTKLAQLFARKREKLDLVDQKTF